MAEVRSAHRRPRGGRSGWPYDEKRLHARRDSDDRLFVQVVLSAAEPELIGTTVACQAVNMSAGGIQFRTETRLPAGALLDLWVDIRSRPGKFFLTGEIRWIRPDDERAASGQEATGGGWLVGVQLRPGAATDIVEWHEFHVQAHAR